MIKQNEQTLLRLAIKVSLARKLLESLGLCNSDCDCGCVDLSKKTNLCDSDCDCGCADLTKEVNLCDKECDWGCNAPASRIEACASDCDCGCIDITKKAALCDSDCNCGCADLVKQTKLCDSDCDCGCVDITERTGLCDKDCNCGCADSSCVGGSAVNKNQSDGGCSTSLGGNDNDGGDKHCNCGCEHHGKHHHKHHNNKSEKHDHSEKRENCNCGCGCENNDCQSEKNLADEYLNLARQIQADFDNYRRRNVEAVKQAKVEGIKEAVAQFLPSLDVVDRAMQYMHDDDSKQGMALIRKMFEKAFADLKIEPIVCVGAHYDPEFHDVVISEESDQPSGMIIEEIETGYMLDGKVIKHSIVKISK